LARWIEKPQRVPSRRLLGDLDDAPDWAKALSLIVLFPDELDHRKPSSLDKRLKRYLDGALQVARSELELHTPVPDFALVNSRRQFAVTSAPDLCRLANRPNHNATTHHSDHDRRGCHQLHLLLYESFTQRMVGFSRQR
jgi:hypothetical protein